MPLKPFLTAVVRIPRLRQTVADQLVLGLVTGGFLGPGLVIEAREARSIRFSKAASMLSGVPGRGEILLSEDPAGDTLVECRLWCQAAQLRRLFLALLIGALVLGGTLRGCGCQLSLAIALGAVAALAYGLIARHAHRTQLRRRVEAFVRNTTYLKPI